MHTFLENHLNYKEKEKLKKEFEATYDLFENEINALDLKSERNEDKIRPGNRRDKIMEEVKIIDKIGQDKNHLP